MRCYVYNKKNELIDLNPLANEDFSYTYTLSKKIKFSVCTNIADKKCKNYASCELNQTKSTYLGSLEEGLTLNDDESITIVYKNIDAETKIQFRCPKDSSNFGKQIKLISGIDTKFHFELTTEYACPLRDQTVEYPVKSLTAEKNGVDFNLNNFGKQIFIY